MLEANYKEECILQYLTTPIIEGRFIVVRKRWKMLNDCTGGGCWVLEVLGSGGVGFWGCWVLGVLGSGGGGIHPLSWPQSVNAIHLGSSAP